ncbi:hypothetical protein GCM10011289_14770 [Paludibacterium paludis]|uniref:Uncharacterized protein n=2 Tax=Paludibacterium paludis TaxID=1225769 RepID=A0A918P190_9NEIS|nr:hypothetical protein GCM10011289_14770 [Paludibacterium paludis]
MAKPDKISRFLPITFSNGMKVQRFGKQCPACRTMVGADQMTGIASLIRNRIFLAAEGCCTACGERFPITCVITDDKRVHRVMIPGALFRFWLQRAVRNLPQPTDPREWELNEPQPAPAGLVVGDGDDVLRSEESLGRFQGDAIPAWIEYDQLRYLFERAAPPGGAFRLEEDELLLDGRLIYRRSARQVV